MPEPKLSLHRKLAQVMYEADRIPKNGTAPAAMGGFKFVQVGDAADVIRKALAEQKISMIPTAIEVVGESEHPTSSGKMMTTLTVRTTWTLTDGDSGESTVIQSLGSGADMGDKAAPKAQSNAMKYALLMGFLLSTGDDPEQTDTSDRRSAPPPRPAPERLTRPVSDLIGTAQVGDAPADFELREEPEGWALSFKLVDGRKGFRVVARDDLAQALALVKDQVIGELVSVWGTMGTETFTKAGKTITYNVVDLAKISTPSFVLPSDTTSANADPARGGTSEAPTGEPSEPQSMSEPPTTAERPAPTISRPEGQVTVRSGGSDTLCGAKGPDSIPGGATCTLNRGHEGKHRELATDGRVLSSW